MALFSFQAAQAQIGVNLKSTTSATTNATINASKATQAAVNATNKATIAILNCKGLCLNKKILRMIAVPNALVSTIKIKLSLATNE